MSSASPPDLVDEALERMVSEPHEPGLTRWRQQSSAHEVAAAEAERIMEEVGYTHQALAHVQSRPDARLMTRRFVLPAAACAAGVSLIGFSGVFGPVSRLIADHATGVGERRDFALPGGGRIWLNTASALSVSEGADGLVATLHAGEAAFERPRGTLLVRAAGGLTRTQAARFGLLKQGHDVRVSVADGRVEALLEGRTAMVAAGEAVDYGAAGLRAVRRAGLGDLAWQRGRLIFEHQPLRHVIADLQRYQNRRIILTRGALADMPVSASFELNDLEGALDSLAELTQSRVTRLPLVTLIG